MGKPGRRVDREAVRREIMNRRHVLRTRFVVIIAGLGALLAFTPITRGQAPAPGGAPSGTSASTSYDVWAIDQGDLARGGTRLYVYDGQRVEAGQPVQPQVMDLAANAAGVGDG